LEVPFPPQHGKEMARADRSWEGKKNGQHRQKRNLRSSGEKRGEPLAPMGEKIQSGNRRNGKGKRNLPRKVTRVQKKGGTDRPCRTRKKVSFTGEKNKKGRPAYRRKKKKVVVFQAGHRSPFVGPKILVTKGERGEKSHQKISNPRKNEEKKENWGKVRNCIPPGKKKKGRGFPF